MYEWVGNANGWFPVLSKHKLFSNLDKVFHSAGVSFQNHLPRKMCLSVKSYDFARLIAQSRKFQVN